MILTSTDGQSGLPRYFPQVFAMGRDLKNGRMDIVLPDGRVFRVEGAKPGPVAEMHIHNPDVFARLIREGDLGFSDAYLDGWWSTPDLQAFMDLVHADNEAIYDGFPGLGLVRMYEAALLAAAQPPRTGPEEYQLSLRSRQRVLRALA